MMKDKITLSYILISILVVGAITFYVAKIDISKMNSDITKGGSEAFSAGEEYSRKLYKLAVAKISDEKLDDKPAIEKGSLAISTVKAKNGKMKTAAPLKFSTKLKQPITKDVNTSGSKVNIKISKQVQTAEAKIIKPETTFSTKKGNN